MNVLHTCISYLDSYVCMKHSDAAVTETFAYMFIIFFILIYVWNITTPLWLWSFCISVYHIMTLIYVWNIATPLWLWRFCISMYHIMTLIYVWNIAMPQWPWTFCIFVNHICIFSLSHICLKHNNALVTLNLLYTGISYFHFIYKWNIASPRGLWTSYLLEYHIFTLVHVYEI